MYYKSFQKFIVMVAFCVGITGCEYLKKSNYNETPSTPQDTNGSKNDIPPSPSPPPAPPPSPPPPPPAPPPAPQAPVTTLYVSPNGSDSNPGSVDQPLKSFSVAKAVAHSLSQATSTDITVYFRGGRHELNAPLEFGPNDSGVNGKIIYTSYPGERAVISGGSLLSNWHACGTCPQKGIYYTSVASLNFRQLYVNGRQAIRARSPNVGSYHKVLSWNETTSATTPSTVVISSADVPLVTRINEVEMIVQEDWDLAIFKVASIASSGATAILTPAEPSRTRVFGNYVPFRVPQQAYHFENALEFLDAPGEWYLDSSGGVLYYMPRAGEDLSTASVLAPRLETLLNIKGTSNNPVKNLQFNNFVFEGSTWLEPLQKGYAGFQAGTIGLAANFGDRVLAPGAVYLTGASYISFDCDVFQHLGGAGTLLGDGTSDISILHSVFREIASNGISVGESIKNPANPNPPTNILIQNNFITDVGHDYYGSVGIFGSFTNHLVIDHNELSELPYTAISTGYDWDADDTANKNNQITNNNIHGVVKTLQDGGGIYTVGRQPGTKISGNYIYNIFRGAQDRMLNVNGNFDGPLAGIYLDSQSAFNIAVTNNVLPADDKINGIVSLNFWPDQVTNFINRGNVFSSASLQENSGIDPAFNFIKTVAYSNISSGPAPIVPLAQAPLSFGGMFGYYARSTTDWFVAFPNPAVQSDHCPAGFTASLVFGTPSVDYPAYACSRSAAYGESALDFGGLYGYHLDSSGKKIAYANPATGSDSCPAGYSASQVLGAVENAADEPLYFCSRPHVSGQKSYFDFGGMFGYWGVQPAYMGVYPNPATGSDTCPAGYKTAQVLGSAYIDYSLFYCYK